MPHTHTTTTDDGRKKVVYISGAISALCMVDGLFSLSGYERACAYFKEAETFLLSLGYDVINPTEIPQSNYDCWFSCMANDLPELYRADALFQLDNWLQSTGAQLEHAIAVREKKEIIPNETGL